MRHEREEQPKLSRCLCTKQPSLLLAGEVGSKCWQPFKYVQEEKHGSQLPQLSIFQVQGNVRFGTLEIAGTYSSPEKST